MYKQQYSNTTAKQTYCKMVSPSTLRNTSVKHTSPLLHEHRFKINFAAAGACMGTPNPPPFSSTPASLSTTAV